MLVRPAPYAQGDKLEDLAIRILTYFVVGAILVLLDVWFVRRVINAFKPTPRWLGKQRASTARSSACSSGTKGSSETALRLTSPPSVAFYRIGSAHF
jgi:hypothetical protein